MDETISGASRDRFMDLPRLASLTASEQLDMYVWIEDDYAQLRTALHGHPSAD